MEQIKLLATTTILTLVIWIGADQLLAVSANIQVRPLLVAAAADSRMIVRPADDAPEYLEVSISGPRRIVTDFDDAGVIDVVIPVTERAPDAHATLANLVELLNRQSKALKNLTVDSVHPATLDIVVDQRLTRSVGLSVKRPLQLEYEVEPKLQPAQIEVETFALAYARFEGQSPSIEIDVEPDLRGKPRGEPVMLDLPVPLARFGPNARAAVETVQVFATLKSAQKRTVTIPTVPIRLAPTFAAFGRPFRARLVGRQTNLLTQTIVVTGSNEALDRLDPNNSGIYGIIPLHEADYEKAGPLDPRMPDFILPADIRLDQDAEPVRIELVAADPGAELAGGTHRQPTRRVGGDQGGVRVNTRRRSSGSIRLALGAVSVLYVVLAVSGLNWGLPTARRDALLFEDDPPYSGARLHELAGAGWSAPDRGADVDADPLAPGPLAIPLTDSPAATAAIYLRYRLYTHQPDEMIVMRALGSMRPGAFDFDPRLYQYGGGFIYPVGALLKLCDVIGLVDVRSDVTYYLDHPDAFGRFYLVSRGYAAGWGLIAVWLVYAIASRLGGRPAGIVAALGFALMPVVICMSHEGKPHLPGAALMLMAVWLTMRYRDAGLRRDWVLLCAACGAAQGMVLSSLPIFVLIPLAAWWRRPAARGGRARPDAEPADGPLAAPAEPCADATAWVRRWPAQALAGLLGASVVYLALNPYLVINGLTNRQVLASNFGNSLAMYEVSRMGEGLVRVAELTADGASLPIAVIGALALVAAAWRRRRDALPLIVPALLIFVQFVLIGAGKPAEYGRFGVFVDAGLMIGAASLMMTAGRRMPALSVCAAALLIIGVARPGLSYHANFRADATDNHARAELGAVINARAARLAAAGRRLTLLVPAEPAPYGCPPINFARIDVVRQNPEAPLPDGIDPVTVMGVAAIDGPAVRVARWGGTGFNRIAAVPGRPDSGDEASGPASRVLSPISWANKPFEVMFPAPVGDKEK